MQASEQLLYVLHAPSRSCFATPLSGRSAWRQAADAAGARAWLAREGVVTVAMDVPRSPPLIFFSVPISRTNMALGVGYIICHLPPRTVYICIYPGCAVPMVYRPRCWATNRPASPGTLHSGVLSE